MMNIAQTTLVFFYCVLCFVRTAETETDGPVPRGPEEAYGALFQATGYPRTGDIPTLNRKIFKGTRVAISEHPYIVSIRRQLAHFLTGTLISKCLVLSVAHPLHLVPIHELGVVVGENYADRGTALMTVILVVEHEHFDPFTLQNDIAILKIFENIFISNSVKPIGLVAETRSLIDNNAFVTGWGRCDTTGRELCLPRGSIYYPGETFDPMLRSIMFRITLPNYYCDGYNRRTFAKTVVSIMQRYSMTMLFTGFPAHKWQDVILYPGMLCVGVAREENPVAPCLAVPGAPLVIKGYLAGIQSWGFGCGYSHDLPLVYTCLQHHREWITHNAELLLEIEESNFTELFQATKAYISCAWLKETRFLEPASRDFPEDLQKTMLDTRLGKLKGYYYDIRDFVFEGRYRESKLKIVNDIKDIGDYTKKDFDFNDTYTLKPIPFFRHHIFMEDMDEGKDVEDNYEDV